MTEQRYVPAAGRAIFTPAYDRAMALTMRERRWRPRLATEVLVGLPSGGTIVDVGCGTGTQAIALAAGRPYLDIIGVDGDPEALDLAAGKPGAAGVRWLEGFADSLPLADASADRVIVSLLLHHLAPAAKRACLVEGRRVLRPGGTLHVVDWGRPRTPVAVAGFTALRLLDGWANTADHREGRVAQLIVAAGFAEAFVTQRLPTVLGTLERFRAPA